MTRLTGGIAALALCACTLSACGSQTKTESVSGPPPASQSASTTTTRSTPTTSTSSETTSTATSPPTSTAGGTSTPGATHSAPEPAFTETGTHAEGLSEAVALLHARGYTPNDSSQYHAGQTLRVLVGSKGAGGEGHEQQAFFFLDGRYIGTDTKEPSAAISVISQNDTEVTLGYQLYRPNDRSSSPSGGQATVSFALNDGKLMPLGTIPPAASPNGLSRR